MLCATACFAPANLLEIYQLKWNTTEEQHGNEVTSGDPCRQIFWVVQCFPLEVMVEIRLSGIELDYFIGGNLDYFDI